MRKRICALVSVLFLLGIVFIACKNDDDSPKGKPGLISSNISSCKVNPNEDNNATRADGDNGDLIHHLEYEVDGDGQNDQAHERGDVDGAIAEQGTKRQLRH